MVTSTLIKQIGNTPLIKLKKISELTGCNIYGKAEYFNPGQSVKDRAALGGTVVEGTAGNTGIGLTVVGNEYGLKTVIVIPRTQSQEKKEVQS